MNNKIFLLFIGIFFISFISSSVICNQSSIVLEYNQGQIPSGDISIASCNSTNLTDIYFTGSGVTSYISKGADMVSISGVKTMKINIASSIPKGLYPTTLYFPNSPTLVSVLVSVADPISSSACQLNPSLVSYSQTFQQGTSVELPKIIFNPTNCEGSFSITSAYISGGITTSSGQKPVYIKTASSTDILLGVDTSGLSSLTYPTKLTVVAFGKTFTDISTITIIVTGSTTPQGNFSSDNVPTCSLTNTILSINQSYSLVCTNLQPDVSIYPIVDDNYIKGTGVDTSSNQYVWYFTPKKMGNIIIKANFNYLNAPIGNPFSQEVKIQSSGLAVAGTSLKLLFTPALNSVSDGESVIIQLIDNKTGSLVESPEIYVNAIKLDSINNSEKSFPFTMKVGNNYEVRGKSPGYDDLLESFNITKKDILITLSPNKEIYQAGDVIDITTDANASIIIDNVIITSKNYTLNKVGNITIKAEKEGYLATEKIIFVDSDIYFYSSSCTLEPEKWKVGKEDIICKLNQVANWEVYLNGTKISSGDTEVVKFSLENEGMLEIKLGETILWNQTIEKKGVFRWMLEHWIWVLIGLVVLVVVFLIIRSGSEEDLLGSMDN